MLHTERANAKINAYLNVVGRRDNGYHNIVSIMQTVSLCDLVSVEFRESLHTSIALSSSGNDAMPCDCRNLAWRAAEKFLQKAEKSGEVRIILEKHIPMAAGLAGGSADAAAVLRALNKLSGAPLTKEELLSLGATLGADVPFCICGGSALVTGIGECMEEIVPMPQCALVVACRGEGVSTPWAYGALDEKYNNFCDASGEDRAPHMIADAWKINDVFASGKHFYNIFEEVVPSVQKDVECLKMLMKEHGAAHAMMSGSGPSVFGVFQTTEDAVRSCEQLRAVGAAAFVCHPCGKYQL